MNPTQKLRALLEYHGIYKQALNLMRQVVMEKKDDKKKNLPPWLKNKKTEKDEKKK